jgi:hypothetical protein
VPVVNVPPQRPRCFDPEIDHRIVDGAQAAAVLSELRDLIEPPELALLDISPIGPPETERLAAVTEVGGAAA